MIEVARRFVEVEREGADGDDANFDDDDDDDASASEAFDANAMEFVKLRSGYRLFNARRGMEYILDLEYRRLRAASTASLATEAADATLLKRVRICRPIHNTELLQASRRQNWFCILFILLLAAR